MSVNQGGELRRSRAKIDDGGVGCAEEGSFAASYKRRTPNEALWNAATRRLNYSAFTLAARIASAPLPLATSMQANIQDEARKREALAENALNVLPPART